MGAFFALRYNLQQKKSSKPGKRIVSMPKVQPSLKFIVNSQRGQKVHSFFLLAHRACAPKIAPLCTSLSLSLQLHCSQLHLHSAVKGWLINSKMTERAWINCNGFCIRLLAAEVLFFLVLPGLERFFVVVGFSCWLAGYGVPISRVFWKIDPTGALWAEQLDRLSTKQKYLKKKFENEERCHRFGNILQSGRIALFDKVVPWSTNDKLRFEFEFKTILHFL